MVFLAESFAWFQDRSSPTEREWIRHQYDPLIDTYTDTNITRTTKRVINLIDISVITNIHN